MTIELTDEQLKQIGIDLQAGKIFTSEHLEAEIRLLPQVFMPLIFLTDDQRAEMKYVAVVYEYISEAGPLSVNGYPTFMSARFLTGGQWVKVREYAKAAQEALDAL